MTTRTGKGRGKDNGNNRSQSKRATNQDHDRDQDPSNSNVVNFPSGTSSRRRAAISPNPSTYTHSFDLTTELVDNLDFYRGDEDITFRIPGYLRYSLERFQHLALSSEYYESSPQSGPTSRPGLSPISSACIYGAVLTFRQHPLIIRLDDMRHDLITRTPPSSSGVMIGMIDGIFKRFPIDVLPGDSSGSSSMNITTSLGIRQALSGLASNLSIYQGQLASLCIAETLKTEPCLIIDHRNCMVQGIDRFFELLEARTTALEPLLAMMVGMDTRTGNGNSSSEKVRGNR